MSETELGGGSALAMLAVNVGAVLFAPVLFTFLGMSVMGFDAGEANAPRWLWPVIYFLGAYPFVWLLSVIVGWALWATHHRRWGRRVAFAPLIWIVPGLVLLVTLSVTQL